MLEDKVEIIVQVNGKVRDRITAPKDLDNAALEALALAVPKVQESTAGKTVRKVVVVPNRVVNVVVS